MHFKMSTANWQAFCAGLDISDLNASTMPFTRNQAITVGIAWQFLDICLAQASILCCGIFHWIDERI